MNKISLHKISVRNSRSIISYEKTKSVGVNQDSTSRTLEGISSGRETLLPYALPYSSSESRWSFDCEGWSIDGYESRIGECMGEAVRSREHRGSQYASGAGQKAHHGLFGRGCRPPCHRAGQAMHEQS